MSAYRNESVHESGFGDFIIVLIIILVILFLVGTIARYMYDAEIMFYKKTYIAAYNECISELPRNKDCEYVSTKFKIVSKK